MVSKFLILLRSSVLKLSQGWVDPGFGQGWVRSEGTWPSPMEFGIWDGFWCSGISSASVSPLDFFFQLIWPRARGASGLPKPTFLLYKQKLQICSSSPILSKFTECKPSPNKRGRSKPLRTISEKHPFLNTFLEMRLFHESDILLNSTWFFFHSIVKTEKVGWNNTFIQHLAFFEFLPPWSGSYTFSTRIIFMRSLDFCSIISVTADGVVNSQIISLSSSLITPSPGHAKYSRFPFWLWSMLNFSPLARGRIPIGGWF